MGGKNELPMGSNMGDVPMRGDTIQPKRRKPTTGKGRVSKVQGVRHKVQNATPYEFKLVANAILLLLNLVGAAILVIWAAMEPLK